MIADSCCPVCESEFRLFVQNVKGSRTGNWLAQHYCMDCHSFTNISNYKENDDDLNNDAKYLIEHQEHIAKIQNQLLLELLTKAPGIQTVLEVGFGIGLFLKACSYYALHATGFELNAYAAEYAKSTVGVHGISALLDSSHQERYDMAVAIGVLEHVERPRDLFLEMKNHLKPGGYIYVNVPFVDREHWRFLPSAGEGAAVSPPNPFYDNDVHIIHFSRKGLEMMGRSLGARSAEYFVSQDVSTHSPGAYPGILFSF